MISSIKQWLAPPVFEGDEGKTRRASLLNPILITTFIYISSVALVELVDGRIPVNVIALNGAGLLLIYILHQLLQRGKVNLVAFWVATLMFIWITLICVSLRTIRTPTTAAYVFVVILTGLLFDWRGILISTIASSLVVAALILAENTELLGQPDYTVTFTQWVAYTGLFAITGGMVFFTLQTTQKALKRAEWEIEARKQVEAALRESEEKFRSIVENASSGILLTDEQGIVVEWNTAQENILGVKRDDALGQPFWDIQFRFAPIERQTPEVYENIKNLFRQIFTSGEIPESIREMEVSFLQPDGMERHLHYVVFSIKTPRGFRLAGISQDITERKRADKKLRQQNEYLSNFQQITLDLLSRKETQTLLNNIVQYAMSLVNAQHGYIFLPDDDSFLLCAATEKFAHNIGRREPKPGAGVLGQVWQSMEAVVVENYGEWAFRDPDYKSEELRAIAGVPIIIADKIIGVLEVANTKTPRTFTNEDLQILNRFATLTALVLNNAQLLDSSEHEISERRRNESILKRHVSQIEQFQAELREQAIRDPLTGLYNRRYLSETLPREIEEAGHRNTSLSVIISDIDHFKMLNDTFGHQAGDKFLMEVASLIKGYARSSDIVYRYGGEEFLLVLPGTKLESAAKRAEEIRRKCAELTIQHERKDLSTTISFGIATYPNHGREAEEIIIKADKALYMSKQNGRNQVTSWEE